MNAGKQTLPRSRKKLLPRYRQDLLITTRRQCRHQRGPENLRFMTSQILHPRPATIKHLRELRQAHLDVEESDPWLSSHGMNVMAKHRGGRATSSRHESQETQSLSKPHPVVSESTASRTLIANLKMIRITNGEDDQTVTPQVPHRVRALLHLVILHQAKTRHRHPK